MEAPRVPTAMELAVRMLAVRQAQTEEDRELALDNLWTDIEDLFFAMKRQSPTHAHSGGDHGG